MTIRICTLSAALKGRVFEPGHEKTNILVSDLV